MGADGGVRKVSQAKVLQTATGADGVAYLVAEEDEIGESKGGQTGTHHTPSCKSHWTRKVSV